MHASSFDRKGGNDDFRPLAPGETIELLNAPGAGVVRRFWCTIAPRSNRDLHVGLILRMYWDGETEPAVEAPIGAFFGVGFGEQHDFTSLPLNENSGGYNCYWPMPFAKGARWTLTNISTTKATNFYYNIDYTALDSIPDATRRFHALYRRENPTALGRNYTLLDVTGSGHYVGTALFMQGLKPKTLAFLEGDEMAYIDGQTPPAVNGTGTEDYFSSGWYFDRGVYSAPYHGVVIKDNRASRISAYRWHIEDTIPFTSSLRMTIEHGTNNDSEGDYASVAYYYAAPGSRLNLPRTPMTFETLQPRQLAQASHLPGAIECEDLVKTAEVSAGDLEDQAMDIFGPDWSGAAQLWWRPQGPNETLTLPLPRSVKLGTYDVELLYTAAPDYADFDLLGHPVSAYAPKVEHRQVSLGRLTIKSAADRIFTVTTTGKSPQSTNYLVGLDALLLKPAK